MSQDVSYWPTNWWPAGTLAEPTTFVLPTDQGIMDLIQDRISDLLTYVLIDSVSADDLSRATLIKVGRAQEAPTSVMVLIHETSPDDGKGWPHQPHIWSKRTRAPYTTGESIGRAAIGRVDVTGGSQYERTVTIEVQVWGTAMAYDVSRRDIGHIASVVMSRATQALMTYGPRIGQASLVQDSFGETVVDGPFLGQGWVVRSEDESLRAFMYQQFWYRTDIDYSTTKW